MQDRNLFTYKCLKIRATHDAQYAVTMLCYEKSHFSKKEKASTFYFSRDIGENEEINKTTSKKLIHYLLENALTDFLL